MRITRRTRLFVALRAPLSENHYEPNDTGRFCCAARGVPTGKWISSATFRDLLIALEAERAGGHTRDRKCQRFRALKISPCLCQEDSETI